MSKPHILHHLQLTWDSLKVHDKDVFYEESNRQTIIPYDRWDAVIPIRKTAAVCLFENETPASEEEWTQWLQKDDFSKWDAEFEFNYSPLGGGVALRAEFNNFDQFTMVLALDRMKEYWVLGNYDDVENEGFFVVAAITANNMGPEEAFPYLMALFHLHYYNLMTAAHGGDEDFTEAISACDIVEGISSEAQDQARIYATELFERLKDDANFWGGF